MSVSDDDPAENQRRARAARNESLFREINERLEGLNETFDTLLPLPEWVCECADLACVRRIEMAIVDYERIRQVATHFPVFAGHEKPDVELVVERGNGYVVVEKRGIAAEVATASDPRA